jgi:hypothetical protein
MASEVCRVQSEGNRNYGCTATAICTDSESTLSESNSNSPDTTGCIIAETKLIKKLLSNGYILKTDTTLVKP